MQAKIRKYISSLLIMTMALFFTPVDLLHYLIEEHHEEVHLCHSDYCVRSFEGHCDFCDHTRPVSFSGFTATRYKAELTSEEIILRPLGSVCYDLYFLPFNKAPPLS